MDPIAEMFVQIRNAQDIHKKSLVVSFSRHKLAILKVLKENHQIADFREIMENKFKNIEIKLISDRLILIRRLSRPGRRIYSASSRIPQPKTPQGLVIVSTSEGIMKGEEARGKGLGGEVIAEVISE